MEGVVSSALLNWNLWLASWITSFRFFHFSGMESIRKNRVDCLENISHKVLVCFCKKLAYSLHNCNYLASAGFTLSAVELWFFQGQIHCRPFLRTWQHPLRDLYANEKFGPLRSSLSCFRCLTTASGFSCFCKQLLIKANDLMIFAEISNFEWQSLILLVTRQ